MSLWRRFFEERELEEEEQLEVIADTLVDLHFENGNDAEENMRPIDSAEAREARTNFVREYYRIMSRRSETNTTTIPKKDRTRKPNSNS